MSYLGEDFVEKRDKVFARIQERRNKKLAGKQKDDVTEEGDFHVDDFEKELLERRERVDKLISSEGPDNPEALAMVKSLGEFVSSWAALLPDRDAARAQSQLAALQSKVTRKPNTNKFTFSKRASNLNKPHATPKVNSAGDATKSISHNEIVSSGVTECTLSSVHNEHVSVRDCGGKHVLLKDISKCTVTVCDSATTVHIVGVKDSVLLIHPVTTSVWVDDCEHITLVVACQQLRMHRTSHSSIYMHVTSCCVIEDSSDIGVAPLSVQNCVQLVKRAGLSTGTNNWDKVQDFNWLSSQHSPNWHVIPVEDRKSFEFM